VSKLEQPKQHIVPQAVFAAAGLLCTMATFTFEDADMHQAVHFQLDGTRPWSPAIAVHIPQITRKTGSEDDFPCVSVQ